MEIQSSYVDAQTKKDQFFEAAIIQHQQEQQLQQQHANYKINHHRRYLSDTSGFKRFVYSFLNIILIIIQKKIIRNQTEVGGGHSISSGNLISSNLKKDSCEMLSKWNPFAAESPPFKSHVTEEDQMFGAEFDKIRQEGMNDEYFSILITNIQCFNPLFHYRYSIFRTIRNQSFNSRRCISRGSI